MGLQMQKSSKNNEQQITNVAETQTIEAIKINGYYPNIVYFISISVYSNAATIILNE